MNTASPLRYPGGKSALAGLLRQIRKLNGLCSQPIAEPFAGGAGASLRLLYLEEAPEIFVNDADPAVYAFWWAILNKPRQFADMVNHARVSMREWRRQRDVYRCPGRVSRLRRGFSAFYLNRCNRSGIIIDGGPIGGVKQAGRWKLGARFNKPELRRRCDKVAEYRDRIHLSCRDGREFIELQPPGAAFLFVDPPYFRKGATLYLNGMNREYHDSLADSLRALSDATWVLTYDDCPEIRRMYRDWAAIRPFSLRYSAAHRRSGTEVLITPKWMRLPTSQESTALTW